MDISAVNFSTETIVSTVLPFLTNLVVAIIIFVVGKWLAKKVTNILKAVMVRSNLDQTLVNFIGNALFGLFMVLVILTALNKLGVNTSSALAILGGAALAVGMALQGQLSSFAAGVMIILFRPFKVGDYVDLNGVEGTVADINIVATRLLTLDNNSILVPNSNITTNNIINYTLDEKRRVALTVGIGYTSDIRKAREVMIKLAKAHPNVLQDPEPAVVVSNLGDSAVDMLLLAWVKSPDWLPTKVALTEQVKLAFDEEGVEIPFPQRTVHMIQAGD